MRLAALDGAGHVRVQLQGLMVGELRHQAMLGASGQDLGDQVVQLGEHRVSGGAEHRRMEFDVQPEELLLVPALACGPQPRGLGDKVAPGIPGRSLGGEAGSLGLHRAAEFVQRTQLVQPFGGRQPPTDDLGVVKVPAFFRLHHGAQPPPGFQHALRGQHPGGLADHRTGNVVLRLELVQPQDGVRRQCPLGDGEPQVLDQH